MQGFDFTILQKKVEGLKEAYENGKFADALIGALNTGNGLMQQRVFTQTEDVEGNTFGQYIGKKRKVKTEPTKNRTQAKRNKAIEGKFLTAYQRKRAAKGRQILRKDLEFTGALRRAIEIQAEGDKVAVIQFNNSDAAKIAKGQEAQITNIRNGGKGTTKGTGVKIFTLNKSEKETVIEQGAELIKQILKPKQNG
jgi:hypothetical protein